MAPTCDRHGLVHRCEGCDGQRQCGPRRDRRRRVRIVDGKGGTSLEGEAGRLRVAAFLGDEPHESLRPPGSGRIARVLGVPEGELGGGQRLIEGTGPKGHDAALDQGADPRGRVKLRRSQRGIQVTDGSGQIAPSVVDPAERHFDGRQVGRSGECRRGLECLDGSRILTQPRTKLTDPGMQRPAVRSTERQCRLKVPDGLTIGEDRLCQLGRLEKRGGGLDRTARLSLVVRDLRIPGDVVASGDGGFQPERLRRAAVEQSSSGQADPGIGGIAQVAVTEVESGRIRRRAGDLADEPAPDQEFQRLDRFLFGSPARVTDGDELERPPDHRGCRQHLCRDLAHRRDPLTQQCLHASRYGRAGILTARQDLGDVERKPLGIGHDRVDVAIAGSRSGPRRANHRRDRPTGRGARG